MDSLSGPRPYRLLRIRRTQLTRPLYLQPFPQLLQRQEAQHQALQKNHVVDMALRHPLRL